MLYFLNQEGIDRICPSTASPDLRGLAQNEEIQKSIAEFICKSGAVRDDDGMQSLF